MTSTQAPARRTFLRRALAVFAGGAALVARPRPARATTAPFVGEIVPFAGNVVPRGWLPCNGQVVAITSYETLFFLIGTTYGGDGQFTFGIPDLRGRVPIHVGQGVGLTPRVLGEQAGEEAVALIESQAPVHAHAAMGGSANGDAPTPAGRLLARNPAGSLHYAASSPGTPLAPEAIGSAGGGQPHGNMAPFLAINYCIAWDGVYPSPS